MCEIFLTPLQMLSDNTVSPNPHFLSNSAVKLHCVVSKWDDVDRPRVGSETLIAVLIQNDLPTVHSSKCHPMIATMSLLSKYSTGPFTCAQTACLNQSLLAIGKPIVWAVISKYFFEKWSHCNLKEPCNPTESAFMDILDDSIPHEGLGDQELWLHCQCNDKLQAEVGSMQPKFCAKIWGQTQSLACIPFLTASASMPKSCRISISLNRNKWIAEYWHWSRFWHFSSMLTILYSAK